MQREDRITYEREETIAQLFHGQRYGLKVCDFEDVDDAEIAAYNRLGEYEDTGMSPAEIMSMQKENAMLRARLNEAIRTQRLGGSANRIVQNTLATALNAIGGSLMKQALHLRMLEREAREDMEERADQMENGERRRVPWEAD